MRTWDHTDPRLLNRKHLLAEHREVHALLNDDFDWSTNPEYRRFADMPGTYGRGLLVLRHELLRHAMNRKWPWRHHDEDTATQRAHGTPMEHSDFACMTPRMGGVLALYSLAVYTQPNNVFQQQHLFRGLMSTLAWPACRLEGGATTPWHRDGIPASLYVTVGDDWQRGEFHHKADTTKGH